MPLEVVVVCDKPKGHSSDRSEAPNLVAILGVLRPVQNEDDEQVAAWASFG
jgi:hypothetical protein